MIIIKTTNGDRFINEDEVKNVQHNKSECVVIIKFKDGTQDVAYGVESMYYTNKADTEVRDDGLMLAGAIEDKEFWQEMAQSAEKMVERLIGRRNDLEHFIFSVAEHPDSDPEYRANFIQDIRNQRKERPALYRDELRDFRDYPYFRRVRKDSMQKGDEAQKEFVRLTKALQTKTEWADRYKDANDRIMKRNLWQRIVNKKLPLFGT